jgi:hypothetical protein
MNPSFTELLRHLYSFHLYVSSLFLFLKVNRLIPSSPHKRGYADGQFVYPAESRDSRQQWNRIYEKHLCFAKKLLSNTLATTVGPSSISQTELGCST